MTQPAPAIEAPSAASGVQIPKKDFLSLAIWPLIAILTVFAFWGLKAVPFHPDESTYLYMSSDLDLLLHNPLSLAWTPDQVGDWRTHLRIVDAPLIRYWLGLGRSLAGLPALPVDWSWMKSWQMNQAAGAVPSPALLFAGRVILTLLLPFSLWLIYRVGVRLQGALTGLLAALLLGLNALVLLHDRRAMAEAALIFGLLFALWSFVSARRRPWLVGLALALAFNAKHTGLALLPVGLLAVALPAPENPPSRNPLWLHLASAWGQVVLVFVVLTWLLNPFLWRHPVQAVQAAIVERRDLIDLQVSDFNRLNPGVALDTPTRRLAAILGNLYITPPSFAEADNYAAQTRASEQAYLANPAHSLLRSLTGGLALFTLNLVGLAIACLRLRRADRSERQNLILLLLSSLFLALGIFWLVPLPWQRYIMPLVPLSCLWSAYAIGSFATRLPPAS